MGSLKIIVLQCTFTSRGPSRPSIQVPLKENPIHLNPKYHRWKYENDRNNKPAAKSVRDICFFFRCLKGDLLKPTQNWGWFGHMTSHSNDSKICFTSLNQQIEMSCSPLERSATWRADSTFPSSCDISRVLLKGFWIWIYLKTRKCYTTERMYSKPNEFVIKQTTSMENCLAGWLSRHLSSISGIKNFGAQEFQISICLAMLTAGYLQYVNTSMVPINLDWFVDPSEPYLCGENWFFDVFFPLLTCRLGRRTVDLRR